MAILEQISEDLINGKPDSVCTLVRQALDSGLDAGSILDDGLLAGMTVVGRRFKNNEVFLPEVLISARAMNMGIEILDPHLVEANYESRGRFLIGTVAGDLHDIGKNLASIMFRGAGFEIIDLGVDVKPDRFVQAALDHNPSIIGLSALLTSTMLNMDSTIQALRKADVSAGVIVGGAPVSREFAREIKADYFAASATAGVEAVLADLD